MSERATAVRAIATAVLLVLALVAPAGAQSPTDQMRQYTEQILKILQDGTLQEKDTVGAIQAAVRKIAIRMFGVAEAAREVLGPYWQSRTPTEQEEFTELFADLLEATYISQMDRQGGVRIRYVGESVDSDRAQVKGKVITRKGTEVDVEARLLRRDGRWFIHDVAIDGISLIANYRAQFTSIIRKSSYEELVRRVRAKRDELLTQRRAAGS